MQKLRLLAAMLMLVVVMVLAVRYGSPYAPVVAPCPENIEEIWAIEDARTESDVPLVTALAHDGAPLAYDAQSNTFYCTLGLEQGDEWPEIKLTASKFVRGGVRFFL